MTWLIAAPTTLHGVPWLPVAIVTFSGFLPAAAATPAVAGSATARARAKDLPQRLMLHISSFTPDSLFLQLPAMGLRCTATRETPRAIACFLTSVVRIHSDAFAVRAPETGRQGEYMKGFWVIGR
jgi:hypothetical protein